MYRRIFPLLLVLFLFSACEEEYRDLSILDENYQSPLVKVKSNIAGQILDEAGLPIEGALVSVAGQTQLSNFRGLFSFRNVLSNANGTYLKVEKAGYFLGSDRLYPALQSVNFTTVRLLEKAISGTIDANLGGKVESTEGIMITFPPNSIASADGSPYQGPLNVYTKYINPLSEVLGEIMPGDLIGVNENQDEQALVSYGMMGVELEGQAGEKLNIAKGSQAELRFPLNRPVLQNNTPNTVPLWYFNEDNGLWEKEGSVRKQGAYYIGNVTHFSFWNVDDNFPLVDFSAELRNANNDLLPNKLVRLNLRDSFQCRYCFTDDNGFVRGKIPGNEVLGVEVRTACEGFVSLGTIGPSNSALLNVPLVVDHPEEEQRISIRGSLLDCDGNLLAGAIVEAIATGNTNTDGFSNTNLTVTNDQGEFELSMIPCNNQAIQLRAYDLINELVNDIATIDSVDLKNEIKDFDLGETSLCAQALVEFMELTIDEDTFLLPSIEMGYYSLKLDSIDFTLADSLLGFLARVPVEDSLLVAFVSVDELVEGMRIAPAAKYAHGYFKNLDASGIGVGVSTCNIAQQCSNFAVELTQVGALGEPIEGNFSGVARPVLGLLDAVDIPISGRFRIIRTFE